MNSSNVRTLRLLWEARENLARWAALGLLLGAVASLLVPAKYESVAQLMPPDPQSISGMAMLAGLSKTGAALEGVSSDLLGLKSSGAMFLGILSSRTVLDRLSAKFNLRQVYGEKLEEGVRQELARNTRAWEDRHSGIITILVRDHSGERAAALASAYVDELNRLVSELSTSAAHRERIFLEQRVAAVKLNLDHASGQLSDFASRNTAIDPREQGRAMIDVAASLSGQLIAAEAELSGLEQIYSSNNVRVRAVQARIGALRKKLAGLGGEAANLRDPSLPYPTLRQLPGLGSTYADLYRETRIQEAVYESLNQEYELAKVQEAKETPTVRVLDAPVVPESRVYPPRLQIMLLSICLGVSARIFGLLARERWAAMEESDARKLLAREVFVATRAVLIPLVARWRLSNQLFGLFTRGKRAPVALTLD